MALSIGKNNKVTVIDRTLPEILYGKKNIKRLETIYFCWMLKEVGVDLFEIYARFLEAIPKLPIGLTFILRVRSKEDILRGIKSNIKKCVISYELLSDAELIARLKNNGIEIIAEVVIEKLAQIKKLKNLERLNLADEIRLTGMDSLFSILWIEKIKELRSFFNKRINICPGNRFYDATALCLEGIMNGMDSITVSFLGYGRNSGFAALEEVLVAVRIIMKADLKIYLSKLPYAAEYFTSITGMRIPENKAVVGKGIFNYQAGIHADAIEKNPVTYEPYEPSMVGLSRALTIGKHSGKRAVQKKLKELGVACKVEDAAKILKFIREKSTLCKRDLHDEEVLDIYRNFGLLQ
ncbi:MAG: 2-isopropylmalate synthase [Firmicutes bacterium ADurb.Bin419]|nr:MAG: 2-isopropylmalate synthase [Firmicutes bacterium ADurb.Bin419]